MQVALTEEHRAVFDPAEELHAGSTNGERASRLKPARKDSCGWFTRMNGTEKRMGSNTVMALKMRGTGELDTNEKTERRTVEIGGEREERSDTSQPGECIRLSGKALQTEGWVAGNAAADGRIHGRIWRS